jgi:8-oxo-dGTP diphosphatase
MGSRVVGNSYTGTAGGHMEESELNNPRACVLRELEEEAGLTEQDVENLKFRYITLRLKNGEVCQNYYFFGELAEHVDANALTSNEGELQWFEISEMENLNMPHSAKYMIMHYIKTGQYTDCLYGGVTTENSVEFTELKEF